MGTKIPHAAHWAPPPKEVVVWGEVGDTGLFGMIDYNPHVLCYYSDFIVHIKRLNCFFFFFCCLCLHVSVLKRGKAASCL